jgi:hypothetical protein
VPLHEWSATIGTGVLQTTEVHVSFGIRVCGGIEHPAEQEANARADHQPNQKRCHATTAHDEQDGSVVTSQSCWSLQISQVVYPPQNFSRWAFCAVSVIQSHSWQWSGLQSPLA